MLAKTEQPNDNSEMGLLREKLLLVFCQFQSPYCQSYAKKLNSEWRANLNGTNPLDSIFPLKLRSALECSIVATGGEEAFDFIFANYQNLSADQMPFDMLSSLAFTTETGTIQNLLKKTLQPTSNGGFGNQHGWYVIN